MKFVLPLACWLGVAVGAGAQASAPTWTLSPRPTLVIGDERNTQMQFDGVSGIVRMPGGEIVVANGLSQELRVFSRDGAYLRTLSTPERGGMRALGRIWRGGDTIFAAEILSSESNIWVFTIDRRVGKRPVGAANAGGIYPLDRFANGRFVVSAAPRRTSIRTLGIPYLDSLPLGILSLDDRATPRWVGTIRTEVIQLSSGRGRGGRADAARIPVAYPYGRMTPFAVSGDRLWIGDSETGTITQYAASGRGLAVFSAPTRPRALDTAAINRARASMLSDLMDWTDRARIEGIHRVFPSARTAPRFTNFIPGVNGEMWIEVFREVPSASRSYIVVGRSGTPIGRVAIPASLSLFAVGSRDVMGVTRDDDGAERIVQYGLIR